MARPVSFISSNIRIRIIIAYRINSSNNRAIQLAEKNGHGSKIYLLYRDGK